MTQNKIEISTVRDEKNLKKFLSEPFHSGGSPYEIYNVDNVFRISKALANLKTRGLQQNLNHKPLEGLFY